MMKKDIVGLLDCHGVKSCHVGQQLKRHEKEPLTTEATFVAIDTGSADGYTKMSCSIEVCSFLDCSCFCLFPWCKERRMYYTIQWTSIDLYNNITNKRAVAVTCHFI
jgi:hypothetical protein